MQKQKIKTVTRTQKNNSSLKNGDIQLPDFSLEFEEVPILVHGFRRMVRELAYDVCEMALTTYLCAREHNVPITALPIFLVRDVHHDNIVHNVRAGLKEPSDLVHQTVAVNRGFTVTSGVWSRAILEREYNVDLSKITWAPTSDEHVAEFVPPQNVNYGEINDFANALITGAAPAGVGAQVDHPDIMPIIDRAFEQGLAAVRSGRLYPINHLIVVRNDILNRFPALAPQLFEAFAKSKMLYLEQLKSGRLTDLTRVDRVHLAALDAMDDPLPYGIAPNSATLEFLLNQAISQGILRKPVKVTDLFAPSSRDMVA